MFDSISTLHFTYLFKMLVHQVKLCIDLFKGYLNSLLMLCPHFKVPLSPDPALLTARSSDES